MCQVGFVTMCSTGCDWVYYGLQTGQYTADYLYRSPFHIWRCDGAAARQQLRIEINKYELESNKSSVYDTSLAPYTHAAPRVYLSSKVGNLVVTGKENVIFTRQFTRCGSAELHAS